MIAQLGDADAAKALPLAELTQAGNGVDHAGGSFGGRGHEPGDGTAMAGDRDLLPGAHRIEQSRQMGLGLEGANAAHALLINQLQTSLTLAAITAGSLADHKQQLAKAIDANGASFSTNLSSERAAMLPNSIPGTLRVLLGALIVSAIRFTMTGQL